MTLLVITNLFFPDRGGGASVFSDLCFGLAERGVQLTVYTTHPYYPEWKRKSSANPWTLQSESLHGVQLLRHGLYVPSEPSKLIPRVLYELSFAASLSRSLFRGPRYDAVMVFCPLLGAVAFATLRKLFKREPLWLNVQDIPADAASASGISTSKLFNSLAPRIQRALFNQANAWSTISPIMASRLNQIKHPNTPLHLCPNWLNRSLGEFIDSLPNKIGRPPASPIRLLYAGNIGKKQGLLDFCKAIQKISSPFHFRIHGDGGEAPSVKEWVAQSGDSRFSTGDFIDEPGFARALHETDLFVITEKSGSGASFIPSKLIPCIATATPVLAVCDQSGPLGHELTEFGLGKIIDWQQLHQLPETLNAFTAVPDTFRGFQQRCLDHSQTYRREFAIPRFHQLLQEMISRHEK